MPTSYSLYELNEYIRRVIALNFSEPIWVNAEISQVKEVRGNVYIDLVSHDEKSNEITAQISAGIWYKSYLFLKNKLGSLLPSLLKEGTHVLLKVQVEFNERYGMKLIVEDIDPSFTIGQMEMNRQKILQRLADEGFTQLNQRLQMPSVVQKIAVISSETAAGYIDFKNHLNSNQYGYQYQLTLYQAALQGQNTERDICQALDDINANREKYDIIIIIRGGGSKLDLAWFDNFNIGARISKSALPVMTGIGHDIDSTVADIVAHKSLKTPTAAADFLVDHNLSFESKIMEMTHWIAQLAKKTLKQQEISLSQISQILQFIPLEMIRKHTYALNQIKVNLGIAVKMKLKKHSELLEMAERQMKLMDPKSIMKRGYSIIRQNKLVVQRAENLDIKEDFEIEFFNSTINISKK